MNHNMKTGVLAILLCVIMIFCAACTGQDTPTQPATTEGDTLAATESTAATVPQEEESEFPENGVRKIVFQERNVYSSAEEVETVMFAHYEDTPEILLMDTETACEFIFEALLGEYDDYVIEETDTTLTIRRSNGAYCVLDFVADSIYFNDFDLFRSKYSDTLSDLLMSAYIDSNGNEIYFHREMHMYIAGDPVCLDLAAKDIPLDIYEGKKYLPFQTMNDLFIAPYEINYLFNSQDVFKIPAEGTLDSALSEKYYSVEASERSEALANFTFNELCMVMDLYYGLKEEHGITGDFASYLERTGLAEDMRSSDATKANAATLELFLGDVADMHSGLLMSSPYTGSPEWDNLSVPYNRGIIGYWRYYDTIVAARAEYMANGVPGYQEVGNTAYITFDSFELSTDRFVDYGENATTIEDTFSLIIYAHSMITRENSPVENVVLDLSCNSGGYLDAGVYVVAWMLGYCDLHITNPVTHCVSTTTYTVDVNLDGVFDEKDTIADKNLFCMISPASFSCGNLVPALLKESGLVTLIGDTSGGGTCAVQMITIADGSVIGTSSTYRLSTLVNGAYYGIDRGVEPHVHLRKFASYYDREALTEYINNMK